MLRWLLALSVLLLAAAPADAPVRASFCAIAAQPSAYSGRQVEFAAHFETDNHHWALFTHPDCAERVMFFENETGAAISISTDARGDEPAIVAAFQSAPTTVGFHTSTAKTGWRGRITGTFQASESHHWAQPKPFGIVSLRRIDDLRGEDLSIEERPTLEVPKD